ncbi:MAG TPA: hypothetical protein VJB39_00770 [Patescibacteria group bacterium]|nr:hypothetical protein [Patescibacteria group bacterium]
MRTKQLMLRWSLVTGGLIALFWVIYYLIAGSVPTVTSMKVTDTLSLPFGISRWWDILIGPIWSIIIIYLFTKLKGKDGDLVAALVAGLGFGLIFGLIFGLASGLAFGLAVSLAFGLAASLIFGLTSGLAFGLGFGLVALIKLIASQGFWTKAGSWLMAKK